MEFRTAHSVDEALAILDACGDDAQLLAGGTDVMIQLPRNEITAPLLLSIGRVDGLGTITANGGTTIGALVTQRRLATAPEIRAAYRSVAEGAGTCGGWQTQAVATAGGNICNASPAADLAAPLLVNDARIALRSANAQREIPYADFVVGRRLTVRQPTEMVTAIHLPDPPAESGDVYLKVGRRHAMEVAIVGLAMRLTFEDGTVSGARLALASVGPVPVRIPSAEKVLVGAELTDAALADASSAVLDDIAPIDDLRGSAAYRRRLVPGLLGRAAWLCAQRAGTPVALKEASWKSSSR